jgi:hypothetical protein
MGGWWIPSSPSGQWKRPLLERSLVIEGCWRLCGCRVDPQVRRRKPLGQKDTDQADGGARLAGAAAFACGRSTYGLRWSGCNRTLLIPNGRQPRTASKSSEKHGLSGRRGGTQGWSQTFAGLFGNAFFLRGFWNIRGHRRGIPPSPPVPTLAASDRHKVPHCSVHPLGLPIQSFGGKPARFPDRGFSTISSALSARSFAATKISRICLTISGSRAEIAAIWLALMVPLRP